MNREISTFQAKCHQCSASFSHPSLGDFSYGENLFFTGDGKHSVYANAFDEFPKKVRQLLGDEDPSQFWNVLASLADPISEQPLIQKLVCPHCGSTSLESWNGNRVGSLSVPPASFQGSSQLNDNDLSRRIQKALGNDVPA